MQLKHSGGLRLGGLRRFQRGGGFAVSIEGEGEIQNSRRNVVERLLLGAKETVLDPEVGQEETQSTAHFRVGGQGGCVKTDPRCLLELVVSSCHLQLASLSRSLNSLYVCLTFLPGRQAA